MIIHLEAHQLVDPDPADELEFMEEMVGDAPKYARVNPDNIGSNFHYALRLLGFRAHLNKPKPERVAALRAIVDRGVALFRRGRANPGQSTVVRLAGEAVRVSGGISTYHTAPRWLDAVSAALCLRDQAALSALAEWPPARFAGGYDVYLDRLFDAFAHHIWDETGMADFLEQADDAIRVARVAPQRATQLGAPLVALARSVLVDGGAQMNERLAEGLDAYRAWHQRPKHSHEAQSVVPLRYIGLAAIAHDRGIACQVESDYLPRWMVEGDI